MKTRTAFLLRFLLPPFYAALGFAIAALIGNPDAIGEVIVLFGIFALYAYVFAGMPALLFAWAMAHVEKLSSTGLRFLGATLLGGLCGAAIGAVFRDFNAFALFTPVGLVVGLSVEGTVTLIKHYKFRAL